MGGNICVPVDKCPQSLVSKQTGCRRTTGSKNSHLAGIYKTSVGWYKISGILKC